MKQVLENLHYYLARIFMKMRMSAIKNSNIHPTSAIESGSQIVNTNMERHSFCGYNCTILNCDIGSFCSVADYVYIGGSHHPTHFVSTSPVFLSHRDSVKTKFAKHEYSHQPRTSIGHDVWIGHGAKLKAGIKIGHGSVIGMGSIVTKDVPAFAIVAGNPARIIRYRFDKSTIEAILQSKWWEKNDEELKNIGLTFNDPKKYLESKGLI